MAAGFPTAGARDNGVNFTDGLVSSVAGMENDTTEFQMTAAVQPGNSGGPVLDGAGALLGVTVARMNDVAALMAANSVPQTVNFGIKGDVSGSFLRVNGGEPKAGEEAEFQAANPRGSRLRPIAQYARLANRNVCTTAIATPTRALWIFHKKAGIRGSKRNSVLLSLRFRNFRSFKDEAELSLVAQKTDKSLRSSLIQISSDNRAPTHALPAAAIYGANSAGKTNVILVMDFFKHSVLNSHARYKPGSGTQVDAFAGSENPTTIEAEFLIEGVRYNYGFAATKMLFVEEWMYSFRQGREKRVFHRTTSESSEGKMLTEIKFGDEFTASDSERSSFKRRTRDNSLFLSVAAQDNQVECIRVFDWFDKRIQVETPDDMYERLHTHITSSLIHRDQPFKKDIVNFMRKVEPSLKDILVSELDESSDRRKYFDAFGEQGKSLREMFKYNIKFVTRQGRANQTLDWDSQSRGFQKLYAIATQLTFALSLGHVVFFDEFESSIHSHIARHLVDLFQNPETNPGKGQLIFTTHDTNMLDQSLLRRDQIWFVEKDKGRSKLYSLLEFSPRKDEKLEKGYLRGRYGAIPIVDSDVSWSNLAQPEAEIS